MRDLIAELKERASAGRLTNDSDSQPSPYPPLSEGELAEAETSLGFKLQPGLRRIYGAIANGGFGPGYGLLGLRGGMLNEEKCDAITLYQTFRQADAEDEHWQWPEGLLPVVHLGCAMFLAVDSTKPEGPVIWFEPNPHEDGEAWDESFIPFATSFDSVIGDWLDGIDSFEKFLEEC
jgi:hypothetical protein